MWSVASTHPNAAGIASRHLDRQGFSYYDPRMWGKIRLDSGRIVKRKIQIFQDYIFVKVVDEWHQLRSTHGIMSILMSAPEKPASIPEEFIADLRSRERDGVVVLPKFRKGQKLLVTRGTHALSECFFDGVDRRDRVFVLLSFFGRTCRVSIKEDSLAAA